MHFVFKGGKLFSRKDERDLRSSRFIDPFWCWFHPPYPFKDLTGLLFGLVETELPVLWTVGAVWLAN